jgi:hypothetical protein
MLKCTAGIAALDANTRACVPLAIEIIEAR